MFQELGSVVNFCLSKFNAKVYTHNVPEGMVIPALFVPPPAVVDGPDTTITFQKSYTLPIKVFHMDNHEAYLAAEQIADGIRFARNLVPILSEDGNRTGQYLRISLSEVKMIDDGVAQITLKWRSRYHYSKETFMKMAKFYLQERTKNDDDTKST
ncbi:phage portal protein [Brevibacillus sp. SYSU BS000544]|uniref:phage portal protein n=1 Tax=Brevibacillus sp. SYSU BS000544 TaxID=3416443 RepID=UPI003CE5152A